MSDSPAGLARAGDARLAATSSPVARPRTTPGPIELAALGIGAIVAIVALVISLRAPAPRTPSAALATAMSARAGVASAAHDLAPATSVPRAPSAAPLARPVMRSDRIAEMAKLERRGRHGETLDKLTELLATDPTAVVDRELRDLIVELTMRLTLAEGPDAARIVDLITNGMGPTGIDILYELLTTRGGSRAAKHAEELLGRDDVRQRGTPAMRIAYEVRFARCSQKAALLDRAGRDGDGRTLGQLQMLGQACDGDACCMPNDPQLKAAIAAIKQRLR